MKISLVLLVILFSGAHFTESRYNHGRRYDHKRETTTLAPPPIPAIDDDRGDEYRELNTPLPLLEGKANLTNDEVIIEAEETPIGYNAHSVDTVGPAVTTEQPLLQHFETVDIAVTSEEPLLQNFQNVDIAINTEQPVLQNFQKDFEESLKESRNNAQKYGNSLSPLTVRGYGFKFSSVVPHDIRYTIEKEIPLTQEVNPEENFDISTASYGHILEQHPTIGDVTYDHTLSADLVPPELEFNIQSTPFTVPISLHDTEEPAPHVSSESGLSNGSGLRALAQDSADQAENAVIGQHVAAQQAAFVAKNALAQSAIHSAATAIAALAGKEVLVHSLERQTEEVHEQLDNELKQLQVTKKTTAAARHAAQQAAYHVSILAAALNNAHQAAQLAENNEKSAADELASQTKMVGDAKGHLDSIKNKLEAANIDFEATKQAAAKATEAAEEANRNANSVGERDSAILIEVDPRYRHEHDNLPAYTLH